MKKVNKAVNEIKGMKYLLMFAEENRGNLKYWEKEAGEEKPNFLSR